MRQGDVNPRHRFFLQVYDNNTDGTLDLDSETPTGFTNLAEALTFAKDAAADNSGDSFIFECKPLYHIKHRGTAKVKKL